MYKISNGEIIRTGDFAAIPADPANTDYQAYLAWCKNGGVAPDDIEDTRIRKIGEINAACQNSIVSGFDSIALGAPHHYTATIEDQANLSGLVLLGVDDAFTCTDGSGVKSMRPHTIAQLKQVLADGAAAKKAYLVKARQLKDLVAKAGDGAAISAVVW